MKSSDELIENYERCRQQVATISKQRNELVCNCERQKAYFEAERAGTHRALNLPENCLTVAYKELLELCSPYEHYSYEEVLHNDCIDPGEDDEYCQSCIDSYAVKVGPLADAKQASGNAKRALAVRGKYLLKQG